MTSPVPRGSNGTPTARILSGAAGSAGASQVDEVYLKHILLQFLEQKEKKHQMQLVPVLGKLLHFDT